MFCKKIYILCQNRYSLYTGQNVLKGTICSSTDKHSSTGNFQRFFNIHVCMYVCMQVCIYAYMYVSMYVCMSACMHVCMYVCMYVFMHVFMYPCMYVCGLIFVKCL